MNRDEFLADLKRRALEIARAGDPTSAVSLMASEINKRPDAKIHHANVLQGHMLALNDDRPGVIRWIESIA